MNVKWCAQWFRIWLEFSCIKVECYIKEVDNFLVCFNGDFSVIPRKYMACFFLCSLNLSWCLIKYSKPVVSVKPDFNARKLF